MALSIKLLKHCYAVFRLVANNQALNFNVQLVFLRKTQPPLTIS
jgi:hypothetical protein